MLRRTVQILGRPKGPPGQRPGKEYRLTVPYRSEVTMLRQCGFKRFNSNIRELFKKPLAQNNIKAIPRDLGELPRNYVLKLLFFNQPVRLLDLWEVCKQHDDVPLDSAKHLRLVLKIAKMQRWVYAEKNMTNNMYYYYVDQRRMHEVQAMVRADEVARRQKDMDDAAEALQKQADDEAREEERTEDTIQSLQSLLIHNVAAIRDFDPAYVEEKPYVTETGAVNCAWHWRDAPAAAFTREEQGDAEAAQEGGPATTPRATV